MKKLTKSTPRYAIHNLHTIAPQLDMVVCISWGGFFPRGGKFWCGLVWIFSCRVIHQGAMLARTIMTWCKFDRLHNLHRRVPRSVKFPTHQHWSCSSRKMARVKIQFGPARKALTGREWRSDGFSSRENWIYGARMQWQDANAVLGAVTAFSACC